MNRVIAIAVLLISGCTSSTPTPKNLAIELLRSDPPSSRFRDITADINIDQDAVEALRSQAAASGIRLVGLAHFRRGVHPYGVILFYEAAEDLGMLETMMYWGRVDAKWRGAASCGEFDALLEAAESEFECKRGPVEGSALGAAFVVWDATGQLTCEGGWFLGDDSLFAERLQVIMDRAEKTYDAYPETPPN